MESRAANLFGITVLFLGVILVFSKWVSNGVSILKWIDFRIFWAGFVFFNFSVFVMYFLAIRHLFLQVGYSVSLGVNNNSAVIRKISNMVLCDLVGYEKYVREQGSGTWVKFYYLMTDVYKVFYRVFLGKILATNLSAVFRMTSSRKS